MKYRRESLDKDAKSLLGMSGVKVYEVRNHPNERAWYFGIVWRDREICSVHRPWDANKGKLIFIGRSVRYNADVEIDGEHYGEDKLVRDDEKLNADVDTATEKDALNMVKRAKGLGREYIY